ncbi:MAG: oligosaccharide flippase family protein [Cyanobacteria bacterium J06592_8]
MKYIITFQNKIKIITQKSLFRNTLWMFLGKVISVVMQAIYFVIVARTLGTKDFGTFMGITALAAIVLPFGSLGSADILTKNVSRNKVLFPIYWGNSILTTLASSSLVITFSFLVAQQILPPSIPAVVLLLILVSDVLCLTIWNISCRAFIAVNLHKKTSLLQVSLNFTKLLSALIFFTLIPDQSLEKWSVLYLLGTASTTLFSFLMVSKILGYPKIKPTLIKGNISQGIYFSIARSAAFVNASIDKTMLASLSTLNATGLYAAAYRLIEVSYLPILVIFSSTYAKFFKEGEQGIRNTLKLAKRLLPIILSYGILTWIGYLFFAPFIPYILGEDYSASVPVLYWLAPMPLIVGTRFIAADTLTGSGHQKIRSFIQFCTALLNILLNYYLIPKFSWKGAVWSTLTCDILMMLSLWASIAFLSRKSANS